MLSEADAEPQPPRPEGGHARADHRVLPYIIVYGVEPDVVHIFRILPAAEER